MHLNHLATEVGDGAVVMATIAGTGEEEVTSGAVETLEDNGRVVEVVVVVVAGEASILYFSRDVILLNIVNCRWLTLKSNNFHRWIW